MTAKQSRPSQRARALAASYSRVPGADEKVAAAKADMRAAQIIEYVDSIVEKCPPLSPEQIDRIAAAFRRIPTVKGTP